MKDQALANIYAMWSQTYYCASWLSDGEPEFVGWLKSEDHTLEEDYVRETIAKIRRLLEAK